MKKIRIALQIILVAAVGVIASGCKPLDPGADPVVVRAEQSLSIAAATFDTFLKLDDANRSFVKTNAAHEFAEWLRAPVTIVVRGASKTEARGLSFLDSAEQVKLAYKGNRSPDNKANLITALATLEQAVQQTQTQLNAVKH